MTLILWITLICYITISVIFNLAMLSFYKEEKEEWSGSEFFDKLGMFLASAIWPFLVVYGIFKMKKEEK